MRDGPDISRIAALIGDPARSNMLLALMDGRALTATELANSANVSKQTASSHLSKLLDGELVAREIQGRHHYYRLHGSDIANVIEMLLGVSSTRLGKRTRTGPKEPALRKSRICYDHLAGELGVEMYDQMLANKWITTQDSEVMMTARGWKCLKDIGVTETQLPKSRRPKCKTCLDWSMRRHHLAGQIGKAILDRIFEKKWARRVKDTRIIAFTLSGEAAFHEWLKTIEN